MRWLSPSLSLGGFLVLCSSSPTAAATSSTTDVSSNQSCSGTGEQDSSSTCSSNTNDDSNKVPSNNGKEQGGTDTDVNSEQKEQINTEQHGKNTCTLYMAPSSIPNAGYGIFTVKSFQEGETILPNDGPNIPVIDPREFGGSHLQLLDNVWWGRDGGMSDAMQFEAEDPMDFQIMFGALPNYHTFLSNLGHNNPVNGVFNDSLADRKVNPGAGAFSYYLGKDFYADREIEAGDEIFLDYGEKWLNVRKGFEHVPRRRDFLMGGKVLSRVLLKTAEALNKGGTNQGGGLLDALNNDLMATLVATAIKETAQVYSNPRTASVLPKDAQELKRVLISAKSLNPNELSLRLAKELSVQNRGVDWIKNNGFCLDNIVPGMSKIPHAGRGAIAQRELKKGETIVPTPLLHIANRDVFATFPIKWFQNEDTNEPVLLRDHAKTTSSQLLLNYCFGHAESSLLLCPVTNVVLINHCSDRKQQCGKDGPNAMYRWATDWDEATNVWLNRTLQDIKETKQERLLTLEIVATRDIQEGEEIFIDYGAEWEEAWDRHVANWKPPSDIFEPHVSATELNANQVPPNMTFDLRNDRPSEWNDAATICWYDFDDDSESNRHSNWKELTDEQILERYSIDGSDLVLQDYTDRGWFWPCSVISRNEGDDDAYTVRIFQSKSHPISEWERKGLPRFVTDLPRESIMYVTKPYRSDLHLPGAFRHHIGIRDEIFPKQWKNRESVQPDARVEGAKFQAGDRVEALFRDEWFTATVTRVAEGTSYDISFDDGKFEKGVVPPALHHQELRKRDKDDLKVGDRVFGNFKLLGHWFPGTITNATVGTHYGIQFDDGEVVFGRRESFTREIEVLRHSAVNIAPFFS